MTISRLDGVSVHSRWLWLSKDGQQLRICATMLRVLAMARSIVARPEPTPRGEHPGPGTTVAATPADRRVVAGGCPDVPRHGGPDASAHRHGGPDGDAPAPGASSIAAVAAGPVAGCPPGSTRW